MKLLEKVKNAKILKGYVNNTTKELALVAIFCALFVIGRQFRITIAPGVHLRVAAPFLYIAATMVSWRYTWVMSFVAFITSTSVNPIKPLIGITMGIQIVYFLSRCLHGRKKVLALIIATYPSNIISSIIVDVFLLNLFSFWVAVTIAIPKATVTAISSSLLASPIWIALERSGMVSFEEDKNG